MPMSQANVSTCSPPYIYSTSSLYFQMYGYIVLVYTLTNTPYTLICVLMHICMRVWVARTHRTKKSNTQTHATVCQSHDRRLNDGSDLFVVLLYIHTSTLGTRRRRRRRRRSCRMEKERNVEKKIANVCEEHSESASTRRGSNSSQQQQQSKITN